MSENGWDIDNAVPDGVPDSWARNVDANGQLLPERALLHEMIVQAVTERRIQIDPARDYDEQLYRNINELRNSDHFAELAESGSFTRADVTAMLDDIGLERLPTVPQAQHTTITVTGGPATGKTALVNAVQAQRPDIVDNAARVNPDDYRAIFASPAEFGQAYADMAQVECNQISKVIMSRLQENIAMNNAPHVLLDVVSPNKRRMALANASNELIVIAGTKPPEVAVEHSFTRGHAVVDEATGITVPGRQTPTFVVLEGAAKASGSNPQIFQHPNVSFELFDTNTGRDPVTGRYIPPQSIASWDAESKTITVHDPDTFVDFIERQNLSDQARSADELFDVADRTPTRIAENLEAYTRQGIQIDFVDPETRRIAISFNVNGAQMREFLPSAMGAAFFNDMAATGGAHVVPLGPRPVNMDVPPMEQPVHVSSLTDNFARAANDGVYEASKLARVARLGANAPLIGVGVGVGAMVLTNMAFGSQREFAEQLLEQGLLSDEAYEAYIQVNSETENTMYADMGVSTADPTGLSIVMTAGVELQARGAFKDWADTYAPHLSEDQFQTLAMSMFPDNSARHDMVIQAMDNLPTSKEGQPEAIHAIIDAHTEYLAVREELMRTPIGPGPRFTELYDQMEGMEQGLISEMESLMAQPDGIDAVLNAVPVDDRLEYVRRLTESETDALGFAAAHPEVAAYNRAYDESWTGMWMAEDDVLYERPELLNTYIKSRSGIAQKEPAMVAETEPPLPRELGDFSGADASYAGDNTLIAEAFAAGMDIQEQFIQQQPQMDMVSVATRPAMPR